MRRLRTEERGFTLIEMLTAMSIGVIVSFAIFSLVEVTMKRSADIGNRVDTTQRARTAMDQITRQLRSQVCTQRGDGSQMRTIDAASPTSISVYTDFSSETKNASGQLPAPDLRKLTFEPATRALTESVTKGARVSTSSVAVNYDTTKAVTRRVATNVAATAYADAPTNTKPIIFRYFRYPASGTRHPTAHRGDRRRAEPGAHRLRAHRRRAHRLRVSRPHVPEQDRWARTTLENSIYVRTGNSVRHELTRTHMHSRVLSRPDLRAEQGFSMVLTIMALFVMSMFVATAYVAVTGDMRLSAIAQDRKSSQAAAEAGADYYLNRLRQDPDFWTKCDTVGPLDSTDKTKNPVNQLWNGVGPDPRTWRAIPQSSDEYTIELIPAGGYDKCVPNKQDSFIDLATGTFRIKVTARSRTGDPRPRSIIVTYARDSFLNYVYFTDYENLDPAAFASATDRATQTTNCSNRYRSARAGKGCLEIQFATSDAINGPLHTNDENLYICGSPVFGRIKNQDGSSRPTLTDTVEVSGSAPGYLANPGGSGCGNTPVIQTAGGQNKFVTKAKRLTLPASNTALATVAANSGNLYTGVTSIRLRGTVMDITNNGTDRHQGVADQRRALRQERQLVRSRVPDRGRLQRAVRLRQRLRQRDVRPAADDRRRQRRDRPADVGRLTAGREHHPVRHQRRDPRPDRQQLRACRAQRVVGLQSNTAPVLTNVTIEAAILALQHSFIVDNYNCGTALSKLTVTGAIVQKYRGPVGTSSGTGIATGYAKNYWYDDRFRFRSPPYFLVPDESTWNPVRTHEVLK